MHEGLNWIHNAYIHLRAPMEWQKGEEKFKSPEIVCILEAHGCIKAWQLCGELDRYQMYLRTIPYFVSRGKRGFYINITRQCPECACIYHNTISTIQCNCSLIDIIWLLFKFALIMSHPVSCHNFYFVPLKIKTAIKMMLNWSNKSFAKEKWGKFSDNVFPSSSFFRTHAE